MRMSYRAQEFGEAANSLADEILNLILSHGVTYAEADDALCATQEKLLKGTKPVSAQGPQQAD